MIRSYLSLSGSLAFFLALTAPGYADWPQWGGVDRNFTVDAKDLADKWPAAGPKRLWSRPLGPGHSSIAAVGDRLYTIYRRDDQDVVAALNAATGETIWETSYNAPPKPGMLLDFGCGPHSTPLVVGDRIFTVSATVILNCLDRKNGRILWTHDLAEELKASNIQRGYGGSPIAWKDTVILTVGGGESGVAAFKQADGAPVWKTPPMRPSQSSLILAKIDGEMQLIGALGADRFALNPDSGDFLWRMQTDQQGATIMSTPVFIAPDKVFFTAAYGFGSHLYQVRKNKDGFGAEELWRESKMKVQHESVVAADGVIFGSSGDFGPAFLMGMDAANGKVLWRERGFAKTNFLRAADKLILLDETGLLALCTAGRGGIKVLAQVKLLEDKAWTAPTLDGAKLYLRDNQNIMALDLSATANPATTG